MNKVGWVRPRNNMGQFVLNATREPLSDRFWRYVSKGTDAACWEWIGARFKTGYGALRDYPNTLYAHRLSYELNVGPITEGLYVLHRCDNRGCVNPSHLFVGTQMDNIHDMVHKLRGCHGAKSVTAKLTEEQVLSIKQALREGLVSQASLGRRFGVCHQQISAIKLGQKWKHLAAD